MQEEFSVLTVWSDNTDIQMLPYNVPAGWLHMIPYGDPESSPPFQSRELWYEHTALK